MKKSREQEILELQQQVFGKDGNKRRTFVLQDATEMLNQARKIEQDVSRVASVNDNLNESLQRQLDLLTKMNRDTSLFPSQDADMERLQAEIKQDFGIDMDYDASSQQLVHRAVITSRSFDGVEEEINQVVVSQKDAVHKLAIALRRPFIMEDESKNHLNAFLVLGAKGVGKHTMMTEACRVMANRQIIKTKDIVYIDLSLYNTQEDEKLFLQDVYAALMNPSQMIVFTNPQSCFPAYLVMLSSLFTTGNIELKKRYVNNKEQLVEASSAFASNTVSRLSANQHYLVLLTDQKKSKIMDLLGVDFINSLADVIELQSLSEEGIRTIITQNLQSLCDTCATKLNIQLTYGDDVKAYVRTQYLPSKNAYSITDVISHFLFALTQYTLESANDDLKHVRLFIDEHPMIEVDGSCISMQSLVSQEESMDEEAIKKELQQIVGLDDVKGYVLSLEDNYKIQKMRQQQGLKSVSVSKHMIFTGNPGTGKTTIARLISKYLRAIGVLSGGQLIEVTRADLVGRYVGHTAPLTMQVMRSALGGVLFIDEAYALYRGKDDAFGLECIDTLVKGMEDYRDDLIVILAGYQQEMQTFLTSNSGLKSRFPNVIHFKDYTAQELLEIAKSIAKSKDYYLTEECDEVLLAYFDKIQKDDSQISGNGRLARNKVEEAILNQASRILKTPDADLRELKLSDFRLGETSFVS